MMVDMVLQKLMKEYDLLPDYQMSMFDTPSKANKWIVDNAKKVGIEITL